MFWRVYERRKKFRYLIRKPPSGTNTIIRYLFSCVTQKYGGYQVVKIEKKDFQKIMLEPIDIIYDPVEGPEHNIKFYFTPKIDLAYCLRYSKGAKGIKTLQAFE